MEIPIEKRRSRLEIECMILDKARSPIRPTNLMHEIKTHWPSLQKKLSRLIKKGFLDVIDLDKKKQDGEKRVRQAKAYQTTQKGLDFLDVMQSLSEVLSEALSEALEV